MTVNALTLVAVTVKPPTLFFGKVWDTQSYTVTFVAEGARDASKSEFESIIWSNGQHQVKSPVSFQWTVVRLDSESMTFWGCIGGLLLFFEEV
ncbi:subtilisin-like protease sbt1.8 [Quercus suber]|uniref:Subtilisin-like protease sbt1.8 n=1 Tax=Quercus suber TaxID=58331 RepID=A0AAW0LM19_QUESU